MDDDCQGCWHTWFASSVADRCRALSLDLHLLGLRDQSEEVATTAAFIRLFVLRETVTDADSNHSQAAALPLEE